MHPTVDATAQQPVKWGLLLVISTLLVACRGPVADVSPPTPAASEAASSQESLAANEGPPPPPSSAFIALLTPEQTQKIRALGVPVVVPTAIPGGFSVDSVEVTQNQSFTNYQILYRDGGDRCFLVEYANEGVGDIPATDYRLPISPPLFETGQDYGLNYGQYQDQSLREQFPQSTLMSDWLPLETGVYRLAGAAYINETLTLRRPCENITPEEAVTVVESFTALTDEIVGDG